MHRLKLLFGMWDIARSGIKPVSPALAGGFFTIVPPGKPKSVLYGDLCCFIQSGKLRNKRYKLWKSEVTQSLSLVRLFATPWTVATRLLRPWDFPGKITGVGSCSLLQGIFPTQGSNPGLPHCTQMVCLLSHQEYINLLFITTMIYIWTRNSRGTIIWLGWITTQ